ncbi:DUF2461 domain-containing protein [Cytophagaceae bacterium ABcell3]|nr:DUF2461 domain-containing protein [Cytophagaceae bacterium ABcell3]
MKDILHFLEELKENNHREWFHGQKERYTGCRDMFMQFIASLIAGIGDFDPMVALQSPKDCVFRINRDIRFSKDKTPYKLHFGAFISYEGRKSTGPGYYVHIQPGKTYFGAGVYAPEPAKLAEIRNTLDENGQALLDIINAKSFKDFELEAVKLKRMPKAYHDTHPFADLLKYKSFFAGKQFSDEEVVSENFHATLIDTAKRLLPFNNFFYQGLNIA